MAPKKLSGSKPGRNKRKRLAAENKENADAGMSVVTPHYPLPPKPPLPAWQQELPAVATPSVVVPSVPTTQSKFSFSSSMMTALEVKPTAIGNTKPTFDDTNPVARIPSSARVIPASTGDVSTSASDLGTKRTFDDAANPVAPIPGSAGAIPTSTGAVSASAYTSAASAYASAGAAYASAGAAYASAGASYASAGAASASDLGPPDDDDDDDSGSSSDGSVDFGSGDQDDHTSVKDK
ncbi:hypothetical protein D6D00_06610 [Aureobasidium pullulans]|nr:hypothetical protein D6D00_06610 [Aureobasidium pullulans]